MRHLIILLFVFTIFTSFKGDTDKVYICDNGNTEVYHIKKTCSALQRCKHEIITVTLKEAIDKYGKRACKTCD